MNASRSYLLCLTFILCFLGFCAVHSTPSATAQTAKIEDYNAFPVSRYARPNASNTGNNNYFSIRTVPGRDLTLVASSGNEDLLLYSGTSFQVRDMDKLIYYQAIDWLPERNQALLAGSKTPPDTGGALVRYDAASDSLTLLEEVEPNLMGLSTNNKGTVLITGGNLLPTETGSVFRLKNDNLKKFSTPDDVIYHDLQWHPTDSHALLVGEEGSVLRWSGPDTLEEHSLPQEKLLRTIDWHPDGEKALIGGTGGTLYLYESGEFTRITSDIDWTIQDINWHPDGDFAILVGGLGKNDRGYWGLYRNFRTDWTRLTKPLFTVEWINETDALMGGQKVLWRVSRDAVAKDFGLTASLSVSDTNPGVSEPVELSGFGSTYRANADSIDAYRFHYGTGDSTGWQNEPNQRIEYLGPGRYEPKLDVRAPDGQTIASTSVTLAVGQPGESGIFGGLDFYYWLTLAIFILSLMVAYAALRL